MNNQIAAEILLVEDSASDIRLVKEALKSGKLFNNLHVVTDGVLAMEFLRKQGQFVNMPTPDLILLDLNLPKKNGREVLSDLKSDDFLKTIPVVVMTTSSNEKDILETYNLYANCYVTKPVDFNKFINIVQEIENFWFSIVSLPKND